jgi:hypothetical protein
VWGTCCVAAVFRRRRRNCSWIERNSEKVDHQLDPDGSVQARTAKRGKHIILTVFTGLVARGSSMLMTFSTFDSELSWSEVVRPLDDRDLCAGHAHFRRLWNRQRIADRRRRSIGVQIRRYLSSAFVVLNLIAVGILVLFFWAIFPAVD